MPTLFNRQTGREEFVPNEAIPDALASGVFDPPAGQKVQVTTPAGRSVSASPEDIAPVQALRTGASPTLEPELLPGEAAAHEAERFAGPGESLAAGVTGALDMATLGGFSAINRAGQGEDYGRSLRQHPTAYTVGQVAGAVLTARPGMTALPAGKAAGLGHAIAGAGEGAGALGRAAIGAAGAATEGAILGAGMGVAEAAISEDPLTFERVAGSISTDALLGAALGGGTALAGSGLAAGLRAGKRLGDKIMARAVAGEAEVLPPPDLQEIAATKGTKGLKEARSAELKRVEKEEIAPQRKEVADAIAELRAQAKKDQPWIALEGFKAKGTTARPLSPKKLAPSTLRSSLEVTEGDPLVLETTVRPLSWKADPFAKPKPDEFRSMREAFQSGTAEPRVHARVLADGEVVATGEFAVKGGKAHLLDTWVQEPFRREGLASRMWGKVEKRLGRRIAAAADESTSAEGKAFIDAYNTRRAGIAVPADMGREIGVIGKITFEADRYLDRVLRNPIALAQDPTSAIRPLQQQLHALDRFAAIEPELRSRLALDPASSGSREAALDTLGSHLDRTRGLLERVEALKAAPTSERAKMIEGMIADIADARGHKAGLLQEAGTGYAAAAIMGALPGGPIAAAAAHVGPRAIRKLAESVFGKMRSVAGKAAGGTSKAVDALMGGGKALRPAALPVASDVLRGRSKGKKGAASLQDAFQRKQREIQDSVERAPDGRLLVSRAAREGISKALSGVAILSPVLTDKLETHAATRLVYVAGKLPRQPELGFQIGPSTWQPSTLQMLSFARAYAAANDPAGVEERLAVGAVSTEDAEAYRSLHPERLADLTRQILERLPELQTTLSDAQKTSLTLLTGIPVHPGWDPKLLTVLQSMHLEEAGTEGGTEAPRAQPQFGSVKSSEPTAHQQRSG